MRAARSAAVRRGALGLVVVTAAAMVAAAPPTTAAVAPGNTQLVTRAKDGPVPGSQAVETAISGDGRHIVFSSRGDYSEIFNDFATNVYARDLVTGVTTQISVGYAPTSGPPVYNRSPNGESSQPAISATGRFVAFVTEATDIVVHTGDIPNDDAPDVVVRDRDADGNNVLDDSAPVFRRISESWNEEGYPSRPAISADGGVVVWTDEEFYASEGSVNTVLMRRLSGGAPSGPVTRVYGDPTANDNLYEFGAYDATVSADGTHIAMAVNFVEFNDPGLRAAPMLRLNASAQGPVLPDHNAIIVVKLGAPGVANVVTRADFDDEEAGTFLGTSRAVGSRHPALSADGSVVAFEAENYQTFSGIWFPSDNQPNVYVARLADKKSKLVSLDKSGNARNGGRPTLSADARYIAFVTDSLNMHDGLDWGPYQTSCFYGGGDGGGTFSVPPPSEERDERTPCQVVIRDLVLDAEREAADAPRLPAALASPGLDQGCQDVVPPGETCAGDEDSGFSRSWSVLDFGEGEGVPSLSADGSRVAYDSESENLTADDLFEDDGDTVFEWDGFVRTTQPAITAEPVDFGPADIGSTVSRTATLNVVGVGPLTIASITVEGADFATGADTCTGVVLHSGGSCLVGVKFTPTAPGARVGKLIIRLADGREFTVDLRGTGSEVPVTPEDPEFSATPDPLDFGARLLLSTDPTAAVTITNTGGSPMAISAITPSGDYTVRSTTCGAVLAPAASCSVVVQFRPTAPGIRSGVLKVDSDAPGGPHLVGLTGSGSTPALVVNPGVTRPGRVVTVSGTGFPASTEVIVGYEESIESAKVTTSNEGAFSVPLLVFPKASIGQRTVKATVTGLAPGIVKPGRLLVVYPTMSPPEFLTRG